MTNPYRILHIDTDRTWRGGQQQVVSLIKNLHALGHANLLASPPGSAILERIPQDLCTPCPVAMRAEWDLLSALRLARIIQRQKPDIIHAHSGRAHTLGILGRLFSGCAVPLVVSRRVDFPIRQTIFNDWKYRNADFYLPISHAIADRLAQAGISRERMSVVYSGVDSDRFAGADGERIRREFSLEPGDVVVGNVAVCERNKCQRTIIEAARSVIARFPNVHFFLVGEGPLRQDLQNRVQELQLDHRIHLPGFRRDIGDFLDCMHLFILVSEKEGLGSSILDAQYFRLPVIATPVGGIPELVVDGETGLLVPVNDPDRLAQAMLELFDNPETMRRMGQAGKERVERLFTAQAMVHRTAEIYQQQITMGRMDEKAGTR